MMREKELDPELAEKFKDIIIDSEGEPNAMPRQQIDGVYYISKKELDAWFGD